MRSFHPVKLIVLALSIAASPVFAGNCLSIAEAAKKGLIKLVIKSKGGHTGSVIEMNVTNNTGTGLGLRLEAGRKLDSQKQDQQDILVTQAQEIFVSAKQQKNINVNGMCCQAHNASPAKGCMYGIGVMGDSNLVKIATFINKNELYNDHAAQQAVWVVSDNNSLGSITGSNADLVKQLRNYVSKVTGKVIPPYEVRYGNGTSGDLLGKPTRIDGIFSYNQPMNGHATFEIYNSAGKRVQIIIENECHERGDYKIYYTFRTRYLPEGVYYARLKLDGMLQKEEKIEL
jgi:hypothetical protein